MSQPAGLLTIPRELRHAIYGLVAEQRILRTVLDDFVYDISARPTRAVPIKTSGAKIAPTWLHLKLSCKTIARELSSYMNTVAYRDQPEHHTYVFDMQSPRGVGLVTWHKIPCSPTNAEVAVMNLKPAGSPASRQAGGLFGFTRALFHTLNLLFHCGPLMDDRRPLPQHMQLRRLVVNVDQDAIIDMTWPPPRTCSKEKRPVDTMSDHLKLIEFHTFLQQVEETGLLMGHADSITLRNGIGPATEMPVQMRDKVTMSDFWKDIGFVWGV